MLAEHCCLSLEMLVKQLLHDKGIEDRSDVILFVRLEFGSVIGQVDGEVGNFEDGLV